MSTFSLQTVAQSKDALCLSVDLSQGLGIKTKIDVRNCNDIIVQVTKEFSESITIILSDSLTESGTYVELDRKTLDGGIGDSVIFQHIATLHFIEISSENPPVSGIYNIDVRAREIS